MTLRPPYSQSVDVQVGLKELAARDARIQELESQIQELEDIYTELEVAMAGQAEVISELERRVGMNSRNGSRPSSSDGLGKPPAPKRSNVKGRRPGGHKGRKGTTLLRLERPDHVVNHFPSSGSHCGHTLDEGMSVRVETRRVRDLTAPSPWLLWIMLPTRVSVRIARGKPGPCFRRVSLQRSGMARTLSGPFGVKPSEGTIVNMVSRMAGGFRELDGHVRQAPDRARVVHMYETGLRIEGSLHWLHVACTRLLKHFRIGKGRGDVMPEALGIGIHDCWKTCFMMPHVAGHGICRAHVPRELENLFRFGREKWARDLAGLLSGAVHACNLADGAPLSPDTMREIGDSQDRIVGEGLRHHESLKPLSSPGRRGRRKWRKGHNLLLRLRDHRDAVLPFTGNPLVPATNNIAELDLCMEKVKQKISGCCHSR